MSKCQKCRKSLIHIRNVCKSPSTMIDVRTVTLSKAIPSTTTTLWYCLHAHNLHQFASRYIHTTTIPEPTS